MKEQALSHEQCCPSKDKPASDVIIKDCHESAEGDNNTSARCCRRWTAPHGASGHSYFKKAQFASSLFSIFHIFAVVGLAKDIFVEKFGCDVKTIGTLFMVISFWNPVNQFIHGNLQDRQCLARFFPIDRWGRRAPWLLTHVVIAAGAATVVYLPPGQGKTWLPAWFFLMLFLTDWGASSSLIAFESARVEIFPFKEERILVEGICKFACMLGGGSGGLAVMMVLVNSDFTTRLGLSFFVLSMSLLSLWAVPVLREAKAKSDSSTLGGVMSVLREAFSCGKNANTAMQHLMAVKCWHGAYGASIATAVLYYVTYVLRLSSWSRNIVIFGAAALAGLTEVICNGLYMWIFGTGDSRSDKAGKSDRKLLNFVVPMRIVNALITCLVIGVAEPSVPMLFIWAVTSRIGLCGFTFWKISAQCWLADEDYHFGKEPGRRREGTIFGALNMIQNFAGAFGASAVFIGLGIAGLHTRNCDAECEGSSIHGDCTATCFSEVISAQPESLRYFVRFVIGFWAPLCELMVAYHAWNFPIKGVRLRKLVNTIRQDRGEDIFADDRIASKACDEHGRISQLAAHHAASKIGVNLGEQAGTASEHLDNIIDFAQKRPAPRSMAVFFESNGDTFDIEHHQQPAESPKIESVECVV